jgi:hypothetical protein
MTRSNEESRASSMHINALDPSGPVVSVRPGRLFFVYNGIPCLRRIKNNERFKRALKSVDGGELPLPSL